MYGSGEPDVRWEGLHLGAIRLAGLAVDGLVPSLAQSRGTAASHEACAGENCCEAAAFWWKWCWNRIRLPIDIGSGAPCMKQGVSGATTGDLTGP